jgi:hypothetical protein
MCDWASWAAASSGPRGLILEERGAARRAGAGGRQYMTVTVQSIKISGAGEFTTPGGNYTYEESGHGSVQANANTVATILQDADVGDGRCRGDKMTQTLPHNKSSASQNQSSFHTHASTSRGGGSYQVFYMWTWTSKTKELAITVSIVRHK